MDGENKNASENMSQEKTEILQKEEADSLDGKK